MSYKEKILHCINCKKDFVFTVEHQELLASKGYPNEPLRCASCLRARRSPQSSRVDSSTTMNYSSGSYR